MRREAGREKVERLRGRSRIADRAEARYAMAPGVRSDDVFGLIGRLAQLVDGLRKVKYGLRLRCWESVANGLNLTHRLSLLTTVIRALPHFVARSSSNV